MMAASARSVLLADSAKFGMRGVVRVCGVDALDALVTDDEVPPACRDALDRTDIEVLFA
jgi:DeoR/GlpR family transcriptional regulator of sugar metabolism